MARLVQDHLDAAGQHHRRRDAPIVLLRLAADLDSLVSQLLDRRGQIVAEEVQLMMRVAGFGRVRGDLRGRQGEDEPTVVSVDVLPAERVAEDDA